MKKKKSGKKKSIIRNRKKFLKKLTKKNINPHGKEDFDNLLRIMIEPQEGDAK